MRRLQSWLLLTLAFLAGPALAGDDWDDFTNNLFTDLAPLLALFGERVTMQYMSQATSWEDCVVLAMGPLGIITIIVSAIRVGGPIVLKAIVGRARENTTAAEMELMSSTSREVCELFNGETVVRCQGSAPVWEFIVVSPKNLDCSNSDVVPKLEFMTLDQATEKGSNAPLVRVSPPDSTPSGSGGSSTSMSAGDSGTSVTSAPFAPRGETFASLDPVGKVKALLRSLLARDRHMREPSVESMVEEGVPAPGTSDGASHHSADTPAAQSNKSEQKSDGTTSQPLASPPPEQRDATPRATEQSEPEPKPVRDAEGDTAPTITVIKDIRRDAPNISLNLYNSHDLRETRAVALIGVFLQVGVLAWFTAITYHPTFRLNFKKDDQFASSYAFPLATGGTVLLVLGLFLCAHVVEDSTQEELYKVANADSKVDIYWLQQEQTVNDQVFESFAINPSSSRDSITMSRRRKGPRVAGAGRVTTVVGVAASLVGYIVQFVGLRGMHSAASLAQLVVIGLMAILRAWVRRGFAKSFGRNKLSHGYELDWIARRLESLRQPAGRASATEKRPPGDPPTTVEENKHGPLTRRHRLGKKIGRLGNPTLHVPANDSASAISSASEDLHPDFHEWVIITGMKTAYKPLVSGHDDTSSPSKARRVLEARRELGQLALFKGPTSAEAIKVALSIEEAMNFLFPNPIATEKPSSYTWIFDVSYNKCPGAEIEILQVPFELWHDGQNWMAEADDLDAALSLWTYSVGTQEYITAESDSQDYRRLGGPDLGWLRSDAVGPVFRVIGPGEDGTVDSLIQDLQWWAPTSLAMTLGSRPHQISGSIGVDDSRVVGCSRLKNGESFHNYLNLGVGNKETVTTMGYDPLKRHYAKDLFFSFMCSAAKTLPQPIAGKVECHTKPRGSSLSSKMTLRHEGLEELAANLAMHGLGSKDEMLLSIIPPLSMASKLPFPQPVFDLSRKETLGKVKTARFESVRDHSAHLIQRDLWKCAMTHASGNLDIWCAGTIVWFEHLYLYKTSYKRRLHEHEVSYLQNDLLWVESWIKEAKEKILTSPEGSRFLKCLAWLYRQQHRDIGELLGLPSEHGSIQYVGDLPSYLKVAQNHFRFMTPWTKAEHGKRPTHILSPYRDACGWTSLHYAAVSGKDSATWYTRDYTILYSPDARGYTPLHYACGYGVVDCVRRLLIFEAKVDARAHDGLYPMHLAAANGNLPVIEAWNSGRLSPPPHRRAGERDAPRSPWKLEDYDGRLPVHWAAINGNAEVFDQLKDDVDVEDDKGRVSLHMAVMYESHGLIPKLCALTSDKNKKDDEWRTPFMLACANEKWQAATILLDMKAAVDGNDIYGASALHYAMNRDRGGLALLRDMHQALIDGGETPTYPRQHAPAIPEEPARLPSHIKDILSQRHKNDDYWAETLHGIVKVLGESGLKPYLEDAEYNFQSVPSYWRGGGPSDDEDDEEM